MKSTIWLALSILALGGSVQAQSPAPSQLPQCSKMLEQVRTATNALDKGTLARQALSYNQNSTCFAEILLNALSTAPQMQLAGFKKFLRDYQSTRNDKQTGSSTGTGGSTNLVSKGLTAEAISVAAEYGALTQSVNNQTVTVQGTLGGFVAAAARQNLFEYCPSGKATIGEGPCISRDLLNALTRISYGITFDTSQNAQSVSGTASGQQQGTAQPVNFTANPHQISQWTGRVALWNTRDAKSDVFKNKLACALQSANTGNAGQASGNAALAPACGSQNATSTTSNAAAVKSAADDLLTSLETFSKGLGAALDPSWPTFEQQAQTKLVAATTTSDLDTAFDAFAAEFLKRVQGNPTTLNASIDLVMKLSTYQLVEDELITSLAESNVLSFEYDNNRPIGQDVTSTFRLIFDKGLTRTWSLTANGAFTIYDRKPSSLSVSRLRDAQLGVQVQKNIGVLFSMPAAIAGSYYFQYQNGPAILNVTPSMPLPGITLTGLPSDATQVFAETGNLHIGQLRLVLNPGKSNLRVPLAVSYSNRTELISKPSWRAQIGVSYDFDGLFAK